MENKRNILVTGGLGFIGSHTVVELIENGYNPIIVDNLHNSNRSVLDRLQMLTGRSIHFAEVDCNSLTALIQLAAEVGGLDGIIHFAAYKSVGESVVQPLKYYENNIGSLLNVLKLKETLGVRQFIFSSSCTVYGIPDIFPVDETAPIKQAESPYGYTKQVGERMVLDSCSEDAVILRYFNPIGAHPSGLIGESPNGTPENLIPYIVETAAGIRKELRIFGDDYPTPDGTCIRDYIHVCDLAIAHVKSLELLDRNSRTQILNVGTGTGRSVLEAVNSFEEINGVEVPKVFVDRRPGDIPFIYADPGLAKQELQWSCKYSFEDALLHAWNWFNSGNLKLRA